MHLPGDCRTVLQLGILLAFEKIGSSPLSKLQHMKIVAVRRRELTVQEPVRKQPLSSGASRTPSSATRDSVHCRSTSRPPRIGPGAHSTWPAPPPYCANRSGAFGAALSETMSLQRRLRKGSTRVAEGYTSTSRAGLKDSRRTPDSAIAAAHHLLRQQRLCGTAPHRCCARC